MAGAVSKMMDKLFASCSGDPKGSVHRAWGLTLLFVLGYFIFSIFEMININRAKETGSKALVLASIHSGIVHLILAVLGTFVLKRFPTSFSVGFFLGTLIIVANQNLILFGVFHQYQQGTIGTNLAFANLSLVLFLILGFFSLLLLHFRQDVVVAAVDTSKESSPTKDVEARSEAML
eukprot:CAMPEP_0202490706 /NCGR_PEP_ID=MMETSP1361-20130828/8029_1 /ASSEMBLY_ACC=CAM_ASM_000849 /TAXON_ID=210615 /ORGANISM="Staurosira complex sp., Strain CCMP2646" /LENGTH=176 /DNA_ID=CAMNT_0049120645 /DNA_START=29 /DNA_END=559 /DNA_ORIENTATION=-